MLAAWLVANAKIGHPVLKPVLLILAFTIAKDLGAKVKPGSCMKGWFRRFLERNNELHCEDNGIDIPKLKLRKKPEQLSHQRARSMTPESVLGYQNRCIAPVLENHPNLTLAHVGGWDEWMLEVNKAIHGGRVVTPPGTLYTKVPAERDEHMTCLSGYVGGWATPVLLVFKGVYLNPQWMEFVPDDGMVIVGVSENGWVTEELKLQWFLHVTRHPNLPFPDEAVLWQFDGHYTNFYYKLGMAMHTRLSKAGHTSLGGNVLEECNRDAPELLHTDRTVRSNKGAPIPVRETNSSGDAMDTTPTSAPGPNPNPNLNLNPNPNPNPNSNPSRCNGDHAHR